MVALSTEEFLQVLTTRKFSKFAGPLAQGVLEPLLIMLFYNCFNLWYLGAPQRAIPGESAYLRLPRSRFDRCRTTKMSDPSHRFVAEAPQWISSFAFCFRCFETPNSTSICDFGPSFWNIFWIIFPSIPLQITTAIWIFLLLFVAFFLHPFSIDQH